MESNADTTFSSTLKKWAFALLTPTLIPTVIATFFIWAHLTRIDQAEMFFESVTFPSLFGYLMVFALVSIVLFSMILFMPSFISGLFISNDLENSEGRDKLIENNIKIVFFTSIISVFIFSLYFKYMFETNRSNLWISLPMLAVFLFNVILSFYYNRSITEQRTTQNEEKKSLIKHNFFIHFIQPLTFTLNAFIYVFPLELFIKNLQFPEGSSELQQGFIIIVLAILLIVMTLLPGAVFLRLRSKSSLLRQVTITGSVAIGILVLISAFVHMIPAIILTFFLRISGIMNLQPHIYAVPVANYPEEYFSDSEWKNIKSKDGKFFLLQGVKIFSLGDIRLICPPFVESAYKNSLKFQFLNQNYDDDMRSKLQESVTHCRRVTGQELLTLRKLPGEEKQ